MTEIAYDVMLNPFHIYYKIFYIKYIIFIIKIIIALLSNQKMEQPAVSNYRYSGLISLFSKKAPFYQKVINYFVYYIVYDSEDYNQPFN